MFDLVLCAVEELAIAANGGDWGYGSLAALIGDVNALRVVNAVATIFGR